MIAMILAKKPQPTVLLGKSPYHDMWMPPQEGVGLRESFEDALRRCMEVECNLELPKEPTLLSRLMHVRSIRFAGVLDLPSARWGERPVADDAAGSALEHVKLRRKAYWLATVLIESEANLSARPDGKELVDLKWFSLEDARQAVLQTNHPDKTYLLMRCFDAAWSDLYGSTAPPHPGRIT